MLRERALRDLKSSCQRADRVAAAPTFSISVDVEVQFGRVEKYRTNWDTLVNSVMSGSINDYRFGILV